MADKNETIIVVRKKVVGHGGHHGGAWKVAYADFVTAMMSLFIVLWLLSSNDAVKKSVSAYFQDPNGTSKLEGSSSNGAGHALPLKKSDMATLKERLQQAAMTLPHFDKLKKQVDITASQDGLRIELLEDPNGTFFELGSATPTPALADFLTVVSRELGKVPNRISIEGHTDSRPYSKGGTYTNWELSADRANAARRIMQTKGIGANQIAQVRGFADQLPRRPEHPEDPSNRRITLIVEAGPGPDVPASAEQPTEKVPTQEKASAAVPVKHEGGL